MKSREVKYLILLAKVFLDQDMLMSDWKFKSNDAAKTALSNARDL
jgi:tetratricopeptide repeat protein 21B